MKYFKIYLKNGEAFTIKAKDCIFDEEIQMCNFVNPINLNYLDWNEVAAIIDLGGIGTL